MKTIAFLIADDFATMHLGLAQESLRIANRLAERPVFESRLYCPQDKAVIANNGRVIQPTHLLGQTELPDVLFVIASQHPHRVYHDSVAPLLKRFYRSGRLWGAIDSGAAFLACNKLLKGERLTVHWEYAEEFAELYPTLQLCTEGVVQSGRLLSCSGGLAVGR